ncbi:MAG: amidohydrolase family protein [Bacteroidia bacterium]
MRYLSADRIFPISSPVMDKAVIVVKEEGIIEEVITDDSVLDPLKIETFRGILCPGFVNTHCHLELSHLKGKIKEHTGIVGFAKELMQKRFSVPADEIRQAMLDADRDMRENGIVAVGDISNDATSFPVKSESAIYYHTFIELLSLNPERAELVFEAGKVLLEQLKHFHLPGSLAPHAPYSVSTALLRLISEHQAFPTSMHNQESKAEDDFIRDKKGDFVSLYEFLQLPLDHFSASRTSALQHALPHFSKEKKTLLVHNTYTTKEDLEQALLIHSNLYWCLCPNANLYIENKLPDVPALLKQACQITVGTDSLASNHQLSVLEELKTLSENFQAISLDQLLTWATYNGAEFLGKEKELGTIAKGTKPGLNLISDLENDQLTKASKVRRIM